MSYPLKLPQEVKFNLSLEYDRSRLTSRMTAALCFYRKDFPRDLARWILDLAFKRIKSEDSLQRALTAYFLGTNEDQEKVTWKYGPMLYWEVHPRVNRRYLFEHIFPTLLRFSTEEERLDMYRKAWLVVHQANWTPEMGIRYPFLKKSYERISDDGTDCVCGEFYVAMNFIGNPYISEELKDFSNSDAEMIDKLEDFKDVFDREEDDIVNIEHETEDFIIFLLRCIRK